MSKKNLFLILSMIFLIVDVVLALIIFKPSDLWSDKQEQKIEISDDKSDVKFYVNSEKVGQYEKFEISLKLPKQYSNPFDPEVVDVQAHFITPSGKEESWPAFWYQDYEKSTKTEQRTTPRGDTKTVTRDVYAPNGEPVWKVRYSPTEVGEYQYYIIIKDQSGDIKYPADGSRLSFESVRSDSGGNIQISQNDHDYFIYQNGETFLPIGHGPEVDLEKLESYAKNKMNIVQAEFVGYFKAGLGQIDRYDLEKLFAFDELLQRAEELGIYLQMGALVGWPEFAEVDEWSNNNHWNENFYNSKNGGPIDYPFQFDSDVMAKKYFKNLLRYYIARWGYSTNVFCWQLWGEFDMRNNTASAAGLRYFSEDAVVAWHQEISTYIKSLDSRHLVTTAEASATYERIWQLPSIDFVMIHNYGGSIESTLPDKIKDYQVFNKPIIVQEYGPEPILSDALSEAANRVAYHNPLWRTMMMKLAGSAMKWTWYSDPREQTMNLDNDYKIMSEFFAGIDFANQQIEILTPIDLTPQQYFEPVVFTNEKKTRTFRQGGNYSPVEIYGIGNLTEAYLWLHDIRYNLYEVQYADYNAESIGQVAFQLNNMQNGNYIIEFWDIRTGEVNTQEATTSQGLLIIEVPNFQKDIAVKIIKK